MSAKLLVHAGHHARRYAPVGFEFNEPCPAGRLTHQETGAEVPCQIDGGRLRFILDRLEPGQTGTYVFDPDAEPTVSVRGVRLKQPKEGTTIDVMIGSRRFTTYHFGQELVRPYFFPLYGPHRVRITRAFPMEQVEGETDDHVHHRSVWVAHGDVNSSDNWSEQENHGLQTHRRFSEVVDGPAMGRFTQELDWQDRSRRPVLTERRTVRFWSTPDTVRLMDLTVQFKASQGPVRFGDTKEGGICAVRVATALDGNKGGRIENSIGGIGESECWGRAAHWVDYSGQVEGRQVGIAVFDHPMNLRHPTPWHVRDYGLLAANPFGLGAYKQSLLQDGSYMIPHDQTLTFQYRLMLHKRNARGAKVADHYHNYVNPPVVERVS